MPIIVIVQNEVLDVKREQQRANKEKPRYDGTCRHNTSNKENVNKEGVEPVIRFKNPIEGSVIVKDAVKGDVEFQNSELR